MDNLQIGSLGWLHESWIGSFYPDDMPEEWRLDYYSNVYRIVLVPESEWVRWDDEAIEELEESVEPGFKFYFQVQDELSGDKVKQFNLIENALLGFIKGIVLFSEKAENIQPRMEGYSVSLVSKTQVLEGWQWATGGYVCSGAPCGVVFDLDSDAKAQAQMIINYVESLPETQKEAPLFVAAEGVDTKMLTDMKTISEFLGY